MNISPILLLSIGASFALFYGIIITIGWAITRRNRKKFHQSMGLTEIEEFDLQTEQALGTHIKAFSLLNNSFRDDQGKVIKPENFRCYIVDNESSVYPQIKKGFLIMINPTSGKIEYAFDIPKLENYR